ncbi:MAG: HAMP domain-containing histidine kinase [Lachnospiraceae bacterium]|nr:HAMP domain-containing histidine kinase [Lachnospiraceae bacterium]
MKFFVAFIRDRIFPICWGILALFVLCLVFWLHGIRSDALWYGVLLCAVLGFVIMGIDCLREYRAHKRRKDCIDAVTVEKRAIPDEYSPAAADYEELIRALWDRIDSLSDTSFSRQQEMKDYYTTWVHQIKTPLSVMQMMVQSEDTEQNRAMAAELFRMEQYVEMALGYVRLGDDASDVVIKECNLDELIRASVRRFAPQFIAKKLTFSYEPAEVTVVTDGKWFSFLLEQLLSNAVKYTYEGGVSITLTKDAKVYIKDTGIGIAPEDVPRVFEKGFTGFNGRIGSEGTPQSGRATGLGLYLCKKVAHKLNVGLSVTSEVGKGSTFIIDMRKEEIVPE